MQSHSGALISGVAFARPHPSVSAEVVRLADLCLSVVGGYGLLPTIGFRMSETTRFPLATCIRDRLRYVLRMLQAAYSMFFAKSNCFFDFIASEICRKELGNLSPEKRGESVASPVSWPESPNLPRFFRLHL